MNTTNRVGKCDAHFGMEHEMHEQMNGQNSMAEEEHRVKHPITIQGCELLFTIPAHAGRVIGMGNFRGKLLITTENGYLYEWNDELRQLHRIHYLGDF